MKKKEFAVGEKIESIFKEIAPPKEYFFSIENASPLVKKGEEVTRGDILAVTNTKSNIYAPCAGVIDLITSKILVLSPKNVTKTENATIDILSLPIQDRVYILEQYGFSKGVLPSSEHASIVINGLYTDLGLSYISMLCTKEQEVLALGMECLQEMCGGQKISIILPINSPLNLLGAEIIYMDLYYPYTLNELLIPKLFPAHKNLYIKCLTLLDIWHLGKIVQDGLPLAECILNVDEVTVKVSIGYPSKDLLLECNKAIDTIDTLVINGLMRGTSVSTLDFAILPHIFSLHTFKKEELPVVEENPCISCGECSHVCPVNIRVHLLNQYAEQSDFEKCKEEAIELCIECGLCDYVCLSKRPIVQYLRNAKEHISALLPMA